MNGREPAMNGREPARTTSTQDRALRPGFWAAILTTVLAAMFAVAGVATPPRSGPFCGTACVPYPYIDVARFVPGDYLWLVPGILLAPVFVVLVGCIHGYAGAPKRIFSRLGLAFAVGYAVVIGVDYFVQLAVVAPSLRSGETQGLSLFTQYNPRGLFIAGEALGYLTMSLAFLFVAPVFAGGRAERAIRWLFVSSFGLAVIAFVGFAVLEGDLVAFEVSVLSINWIVLIASGCLLSVVFWRAGTIARLQR